MVYGHGGVPFLAFPTQDSLCHNYEEFGMIRELSGYLENGKIQYFVVDTNDKESWS
jgi:esterase/lipase superfamily enzyme